MLSDAINSRLLEFNVKKKKTYVDEIIPVYKDLGSLFIFHDKSGNFYLYNYLSNINQILYTLVT